MSIQSLSATAPTSLEQLIQHRTARADGPESRRVWLFHSHVYFDHLSPQRVAEASAFMDCIGETFATTAHVEVNGFIPFPAGPHPRGSFEVLFTRDAFAEYVTWLMFARPVALDILVHPLTRSQAQDHSERAFWLGKPLAIDFTMLDTADALARTLDRSEESIIEATKRHSRAATPEPQH